MNRRPPVAFPSFACLTAFVTDLAVALSTPAVLAIDGRSGAGKSTLAAALADSLAGECNLFHTDDFFLPPAEKTPARLAMPGGNTDRERFLREVLLPLSRGETVHYRRYDCHSDRLLPAQELAPRRLSIVEGVYALHPALTPYYSLRLFLDIGRETQKMRIERRNPPPVAARYFREWIPAEERYFDALSVRENADMILYVEGL